ncbi:MAG: hypothetical protein WC890_07465, partial [Candidatus Margulisiibacteriota bacterium]
IVAFNPVVLEYFGTHYQKYILTKSSGLPVDHLPELSKCVFWCVFWHTNKPMKSFQYLPEKQYMFILGGKAAYTKAYVIFDPSHQSPGASTAKDLICRNPKITVRAMRPTPKHYPFSLDATLRDLPGLTTTQSLQQNIFLFLTGREMLFLSMPKVAEDSSLFFPSLLPGKRIFDAAEARTRISFVKWIGCDGRDTLIANSELTIYQVIQLLALTRGIQPAQLSVKFSIDEIIGKLVYWKDSTVTLELPLCNNKPFVPVPFRSEAFKLLKFDSDVHLPTCLFVLSPALQV